MGKRVNLSFSGASLFFCSPIRADGTPMPSSVLKIDTDENIEEESVKTSEFGSLFGITTPKVKDLKHHEVVGNDPASIMQIDLCGGVFGLPEFATAPPVSTFADVIQAELSNNTGQVMLVPILNEAFGRRMRAFTMSFRVIKSVNMFTTYKVLRFISHGILNRQKEGERRRKKAEALGKGFLNPLNIDELDPEGSYLLELADLR